MTLKPRTRMCIKPEKLSDRIFSFGQNRDGSVAIEFVFCALVLIPVFLGLSDVLRANQLKQATLETGESILRAMRHVPEYDGDMRKALTVFCNLNRSDADDFDIEIVSGTFSDSNYNIDWSHFPCGDASDSFVKITESDLNAELSGLNLQDFEGFVAVKVTHVANELDDSKYFYAPDDHTFNFLDASIPRIANTVIYTEDDLYDIDEYEY